MMATAGPNMPSAVTLQPAIEELLGKRSPCRDQQGVDEERRQVVRLPFLRCEALLLPGVEDRLEHGRDHDGDHDHAGRVPEVARLEAAQAQRLPSVGYIDAIPNVSSTSSPYTIGVAAVDHS